MILAQDPAESGFDGMPSSAIATGLVDQVLRVAAIADALDGRGGESPLTMSTPFGDASASSDPLQAIVALLRAGTGHDFAPYKRGTLDRRIERRMALARGASRPDNTDDVGNRGDSKGRPGDKMAAYLARLRTDPAELDLLAKDLFIHVTSFFRDPPLMTLWRNR